jgi:hypothetical protein
VRRDDRVVGRSVESAKFVELGETFLDLIAQFVHRRERVGSVLGLAHQVLRVPPEAGHVEPLEARVDDGLIDLVGESLFGGGRRGLIVNDDRDLGRASGRERHGLESVDARRGFYQRR